MSLVKQIKDAIFSQRHRAFTLAEVLITIAVVGIVAALTISNLVKVYQEKAAVAKVKETYALVSEAVKKWESDEGCIGQIQRCMQTMSWNWGEVYPEEPRLEWTKNLKVVAKRTTRWQGLPTATKFTWLNYNNYGLDGTMNPSTYLGVTKASESHRVFQYLLSNGAILAISSAVGDFIWMDINGKDKPNRIGKDQFPMGFSRGWDKNYGLIPYYTECTWVRSNLGVCSHNCPNPCNPDDGRSPTAYVLKHNKLPDLEAMGYPKSP